MYFGVVIRYNFRESSIVVNRFLKEVRIGKIRMISLGFLGFDFKMLGLVLRESLG